MEFRDYTAMITRQWWLILGAVLAGIAVGALVTLITTPTYRAQSRIFVSTQLDAGNTASQLNQGGSFASDRVRSYESVVTSPRVTAPVIAALGLPDTPDDLAERISADAPADTAVLTITVDDPSPVAAAAITNAIAEQLGRAVAEIETPAGGTTSPVKTTILAPATVPTDPVAPSATIDIGLGLLLGLIVGFGGAILRETLDTRVRDSADVARVTNMPILASVFRDDEAPSEPIARRDPQSQRREAFRQLRTNLQFASVDSASGVVMVTSAVAGEGKSSVTGNLAVAAAAAGMRTCIVDGDLRRPSVARYFGLVPETGLTTVLIGRADLDDALQPVEHNLVALTSGTMPPNPNEMLASTRTTEVFAELARRFDLVLVDTPPTLPVGDAAVLASKTDGVVLVVRSGGTTRTQLGNAVETLGRVDAHLYGVVLNMIAPQRRTASDYGYRYDGYRRQVEATPASPALTTGSAEASAPVEDGQPAGDDADTVTVSLADLPVSPPMAYPDDFRPSYLPETEGSESGRSEGAAADGADAESESAALDRGESVQTVEAAPDAAPATDDPDSAEDPDPGLGEQQLVEAGSVSTTPAPTRTGNGARPSPWRRSRS